MLYTPLTIKAMKLCYETHAGETDKGGTPYVFHPMHIAEQFNNFETHICAALLHDVPESPNNNYDVDYIRLEFGDTIGDAVDSLTRRSNETYSEYITRLSKNTIAREVKIKDISHNMNKTRLSLKTPADNKIADNLIKMRYRPAISYLIDGYCTYETFDKYRQSLKGE